MLLSNLKIWVNRHTYDQALEASKPKLINNIEVENQNAELNNKIDKLMNVIEKKTKEII